MFSKVFGKGKKLNQRLDKKSLGLYILLILINIGFTIFTGRRTVINYAPILDKKILITSQKYLFLGRGYANLMIILFFSFYSILLSKFFMKKKITWKLVLFTLLFYFILDVLLFFCFVKRIF